MGFHRGFVGSNSLAPDAPSWNALTPGNGSISLSWVRPYSDAYNVTGYVVELSTDQSTWSAPGSITYDMSARTAVVTNLTVGTTYYFRVRAIIGGSLDGSWSPSSPGIVFGTVPAQTSTPTTSLGAGTIILSWSAPASNGYSISGYTVQYSSNSGSTWTTANNVFGTSYVFSGSNGVSYVFRVAAYNQLGTGSYSSQSASATQMNVPAKPATPVASKVVLNGALRLIFTWVIPANNGSVITSQTVHLSPNGGVSWFTYTGRAATDTSIQFGGLTVGTTYIARVAAVNSMGTGPFSDWSNAITW
jgi:Fibronectin type III domain